MRLLRPLRDAYPDASAVRELLGLCQYRLGQYPAAAKELEAFVELTDSVEQHPVLMDCARAMGKYKRASTSCGTSSRRRRRRARSCTEGRIVLAGSRADRGRINDAIAILERRGGNGSACRNTTCGSGTRSPTCTSAPARSRRPVTCSCGSAATTRRSPTSPSGSRLG